MNRRTCARISTVLATALSLVSLSACQTESESEVSSSSSIDDLPSVVDRIPDNEVSLTEYGARGDGKSDSTDAFDRAISALDASGGGRLIVPEGIFLTGAIHLEDNIELHIDDSATVKFSQNPNDFLPVVKTRFEGTELYNYSPLIYAQGKNNIAITGNGTLDGNADNEHWWPWKGKEEFGWAEGEPNQAEDAAKLMQMGENDVPVEERQFGKGHQLRPSMIEFYKSKNVLMEGVTVKDSPMWHIHPVLSTNVTIEGITVNGHGPNGDGINPESSSNVLIRDNDISTGDDGIAIKSGKNNDGRRVDVPSKNIHIEDNRFKEGHGAITIGSEMSGGVEGVYASGNVMDSPNLWNALRIKTNTDRGGYAKNIRFTDNEIHSAAEDVINLTTNYVNDGEQVTSGEHIPRVEEIAISDISSVGGTSAISMEGLPECPVTDVTITDSEFTGVDEPYSVSNVTGVRVDNLKINGDPIDSLTEGSDTAEAQC
jgi:polygalacturonase